MMRIKHLAYTFGITALLTLPLQFTSAADKPDAAKATAAEKAFIMKAATGGMTEVDLGNAAAEKGGSDEVKDFGKQMVKDHSSANEKLKTVAAKLGVTVPEKIGATHKAKVDKMSGLSGAAFDKMYVAEMVKAHKKDIADFEMAGKEVKNADLKSFIDETVPVMKEHLEMIKKFDQAKK